MRRVKMWFWDFLYHGFTHLSMVCAAHYIKAKYGTYPEWYGKWRLWNLISSSTASVAVS